MASINRHPETLLEYNEILKAYWYKMAPKYSVSSVYGDSERMEYKWHQMSLWADSELETFSVSGGADAPDSLILEPNRWMVLFRAGKSESRLSEIFIIYVLDIVGRKGGYQTMWSHPPLHMGEGFMPKGEIFQDWPSEGWGAYGHSTWAYLDVEKYRMGFINWPFDNPLPNGGGI